jgi:hypothetical protein
MSIFEQAPPKADERPHDDLDADTRLIMEAMLRAGVYDGINGDTKSYARQRLGWHALQIPEPAPNELVLEIIPDLIVIPEDVQSLDTDDTVLVA